MYQGCLNSKKGVDSGDVFEVQETLVCHCLNAASLPGRTEDHVSPMDVDSRVGYHLFDGRVLHLCHFDMIRSVQPQVNKNVSIC